MPHLKRALLCYCFGLFATVFAFMAAYFTQLRLYEEERDRHAGRPVRQLHGIGIRIGAAFALIAAFAFLFGCLYAASALKKGWNPVSSKDGGKGSGKKRPDER